MLAQFSSELLLFIYGQTTNNADHLLTFILANDLIEERRVSPTPKWLDKDDISVFVCLGSNRLIARMIYVDDASVGDTLYTESTTSSSEFVALLLFLLLLVFLLLLLFMLLFLSLLLSLLL